MGSLIRALFNIRMLVVVLMGFSSGLPLLVTGSTLQAFMHDAKVDLSIIGIFSLVGLPYTLKFVWAPVLDRFIPPFLGRRRGWALISQIALAVSILWLGMNNPMQSPWLVAAIAVLVTFFSATQDIVLDAYRREILADEELGLGSSLFINAYRIGMLVSGAFALFLADHMSWPAVFAIIASFMGVGILTTIFAPEPKLEGKPPQTLRAAIVDPFREFFKRRGALEILLFVLLYKIGDQMASHMTTPFVLDLGFSKTEYGVIAKTFGMVSTIAGGFIGGLIMVKMGINRSLWIFGILQMVSTLSFSVLAMVGYSQPVLASVVAIEMVSGGMGTSAYAAFMAALCNKRFTATQYALLSSFMGIPRSLAAAPTGFLAQSLGWTAFFIFCTLIAIPGLLMLKRVAPWGRETHFAGKSR